MTARASTCLANELARAVGRIAAAHPGSSPAILYDNDAPDQWLVTADLGPTKFIDYVVAQGTGTITPEPPPAPNT